MFANIGYAREEHGDPPSDSATFYHDVEPTLAVEALAKGRRQSETPSKEPWPLAAWPDVPTRYLLCRHQDRLFPWHGSAVLCAIASASFPTRWTAVIRRR